MPNVIIDSGECTTTQNQQARHTTLDVSHSMLHCTDCFGMAQGSVLHQHKTKTRAAAATAGTTQACTCGCCSPAAAAGSASPMGNAAIELFVYMVSCPIGTK